MVSDHDRRLLFDALENRLGEGPAAILMELLPPVGWADVARSSELVAQGTALRGAMAELRAELQTLLPKLVAANVASMIGVAGLVLAAAKLA
jgi:hypothetical protein